MMIACALEAPSSAGDSMERARFARRLKCCRYNGGLEVRVAPIERAALDLLSWDLPLALRHARSMWVSPLGKSEHQRSASSLFRLARVVLVLLFCA